MKKHVLSVLIVFLSIYTGIAVNGLRSPVSISTNLVTLTSPSELDSLALVALYNQCNGVNWTKQTNWLTGPLSTWQGVTVENGRVVSLDLGDVVNSVGLTGLLPVEISNLTEIRNINLSNNQLTGNLPDSWSGLVNLTQLDLRNNLFTGALPLSWSLLVNLIGLSLGSNQLTGTLPEEWKTLVKLDYLMLYDNQLTGILPDSWASLVNLTYLTLYQNQLSGSLPSSWSALFNLQILYLHNNKLTGTLPGAWSSLTELTELTVSNNQLTGFLPQSWAALLKLTSLQLDYNQLTGSLPTSWSTLVNLSQLGISSNQFTGTLPDEWKTLVKLTFLTLSSNQLSGKLPDSWASLVNLLALTLWPNQLSGPLTQICVYLAKLQELDLYDNQFTGPVPDTWATLTTLTQLTISKNQISGLPALSALMKLNYLDVGNNLLDFGSLEPNIGIPISTFNYSPQANVGQSATIIKNLGDQVSTFVNVGGQHNQYQWFKNGSPIPGSTGANFTISSVALADAGDYTCQITNTVATQLTLTSNPITLQIGNKIFNTNSDSLALVALYKQCNGINWAKQTNWLTGPLSIWQGVTLENGRVVGLELGFQPSVGLTGQLPAEISNLTEIRTLNLSNNQLTGNLPDNWTSLVNLSQLNIASNQLTGLLPVSWSALTNLIGLDFSNNQLTGNLPKTWSALANLKYLSLGYNKLSGTLPDEWVALSILSQVNLTNNQFSGLLPRSWSAISHLQVLQLGQNQFSGTLPDSWSALLELTQLLLNNNQFTGSLPATWSAMVNMTQLDLMYNNLSGSLPNSWSELVNLQSLILTKNQLSGNLPDSWSSMTSLQNLVLYDNQLTGNLPSSWSALINLAQIYLRGNQLTGTLPDSWKALVNLTNLSLSYNQFTGKLPESWLALTNLQFLYLDHNQISDLPKFSSLTKLTDLLTQNNSLDFGSIEPNVGIPKSSYDYSQQAPVGQKGTINKNIGELFNIHLTVGGLHNQYQWFKNESPIPGATGASFTISSIALSDAGDYTCQITNTVATQLTLTSNPISLYIGNMTFDTNSDSLALVALYKQCNGVNWTKQTNWLTGRLSTWEGVTVENGRVVSLAVSDFANPGGLIGQLPAELANLTELITLNLSNNRLTGTLPDSWTGLVKLKQLNLGFNQLTGPLPERWSTLTQLQFIYLGGNQLSGTLPASWSSLVHLTDLILEYNQFNGPLPESWSTLIQLQQLSLGSNQLSGQLPDSWKSLVNIQELRLFTNQFNGHLPESWSALINIQSLMISGNKFTGSLPDSWAALVKLTTLFLSDNQFSGSPPPSWSTLVKLTQLNLSLNQLSGKIPDSWLALANLTQLNISYNQISGMPILTSLTRLSELSVQNNFLDFGPIEPVMQNYAALYTYSYSPQAPVGQVATLVRNPGEEFRISLNVGGQSNKYQWYKNGTAIPGATSNEYLISSVTAADAAIYTCQITNTVATKLTLSSNPITLQIGASVPVANAGIDQAVDMGSTVILDSSGSSHDAGKTLTYKWTPPSGITLSSTTAAKPTFTAPQVTTDTNYTFTLVVNDGTSDSPADQVIITVKFVTSNMTPCEKDPIRDVYLEINYKPDHLDIRHKLLTCAIPLDPVLTYVWDMGDGTTRNGTVIQHSYPISNDVMSYTLSVTVSNSSGCERTTSRVIEVIPFIPNVFSPNGDGINDVFMPKVKLKIFDRYGTVFYEGTDGWDGTYKGKVLEPDTYFYSIEYTDWKNKVQTRRGFITLVK